MKKTLTIFTPAYNRAYTIHKCYESLKRQTSKDFIWLVVDDGSTDGTKNLILKWQEEVDFEIRYIYKENGGMHTAHNTAYENIDTELNVCIDSDDYMTDDAVEIIVSEWKKVRNENIAGIGALNVFEDRKVIGSKFPEDLKKAKYFDIYHKYGVRGDKKFIYRTDLIRNFPYPEFKDEKYVGLDYKYKKLDENYELALINEVVCIVEYMDDGSSKNMLRQYRKNPKGWCFFRLENLKIPNTSIKYKFKECIHYVSSSLMIKDYNFIKKSPKKNLTICAIPFGILLNIYIKLKVKQ
ncbi:glycosyltransferase family 2 protein [Clostridium perfringens]|uniref:glycosyltransferase family A protein n=1 Tax=Clostridium perfringens TaxID=1502 RepID=UPI001DFF05C1|nr:glycosyltransferase family A protein [Clostridium perfringens]EHK2338403.1 glycosyltransferase family 2 protein [Clostridium perfringens]MCC5421799.1 glycosyltransferase family 2 protein [Clostridium perfringens]MCC5431459.1 glycosyltransferase family 2 protein [Clostridium perfringens]MDK0855101.1 glycosyltransferase family A protein [Clostridium perfringens]WVL75790.1 glycosyltransferase family A protein [Clostridium perfringens]